MTDSNSQHQQNNSTSRYAAGFDKTVNHVDNEGTLPHANDFVTVNHDNDVIHGNGTVADSRRNVTVAPENGGIVNNPSKNIDFMGRQGIRWMPGDKILDRYVVLNELGQGGMGVVYRCLDSIDKLGKTEVAVKSLPPEVSHNPSEMDGMWKNYGLVSRLVHQNIAAYKTLEMDAKTGDYYLVMEYVEGESLRSWMRKRMGKKGGMPLQTARLILQQIALALDAAHEQKIIHRDIKPDNVMIKPDGRTVKVLDFGLAAQIRSSMTRVSKEDVSLHAGTNLYKAPEQWRGQMQGAATDQYALAVTAYEMLSGHVPFYDDNVDVLKKAVLEETPPNIQGIPQYANNALQAGLAKESANRYATCVDFVRALGGENVSPGGVFVETFNEDDFYLLCAKVDRYREKYAKTDWDRGQTFGKHLEAFADDYGAASAARTDQRLQKANDFLKKAEAEWQWLERNLPLRQKAAECRATAQKMQKQAENNQPQIYAKDGWREALHSLEIAVRYYETGEFEVASEEFNACAAMFETVAKDALSEHIRRLEQAIAEALEQKKFKECEESIRELSMLDEAQGEKLLAIMNNAKADYIKQLKAMIPETIDLGQWSAIYNTVMALKTVDEAEGSYWEDKVNDAKNDYLLEQEKIVSDAIEQRHLRDAEVAIQEIAVVDAEKATELTMRLQGKKAELVQQFADGISEDLQNWRIEAAHDKVRELSVIDDAEGKKWEPIIHVRKLEQDITDAVAENRFDEADGAVVELSKLDEEVGQRKKNEVETAKTERAKRLAEFIAEETEQGHFKSAREMLGELAAINEMEARRHEESIRIAELEQVISDAIAEHQFEVAEKDIQELATLNTDKAREKAGELKIAKETRVKELVDSINSEIEKRHYEAAYELQGELTLLDAAEARKRKDSINAHELVDIITKAIERNDFGEADKTVQELVPLDSDKAREQAATVKAAKDARIHILDRLVRDALKEKHFNDLNGSIDEMALLDKGKADDLNRAVENAKSFAINQLESIIEESLKKENWEAAYAAAHELSDVDAEKGKPQEDAIRERETETKRINSVRELEKTISVCLMKRNYVEAEKAQAELHKLDEEKARPWGVSIQAKKAERIKELSESIYKSIEEGSFPATSNLELQELDELDPGEAEKARKAIESKKSVFINYLAQTVEDAISEKRFDDAEKTAGEIGAFDPLKSAGCMKSIQTAKDYYIRQLERQVFDCLEQDRFEDANEFLKKLAAISSSNAKIWEDKLLNRKLVFAFQKALEDKRFDEAEDVVQQVAKKDPETAKQMKKRIDSARMAHAEHLEEQIRDTVGQKNFIEALKLVKELYLLNNTAGKDQEKIVSKKLGKHVSRMEKDIHHDVADGKFTDAHGKVEEMKLLDATKATEMEAFVKEAETGGKKTVGNRWLKIAVALFLLIAVVFAVMVHRGSQIKSAENARKLADVKKTAADKKLARMYAQTEYLEANSLMSDADRQFNNSHFKQAKIGFDKARAAYVDAAEKARNGRIQRLVGKIDDAIDRNQFYVVQELLDELVTLDSINSSYFKEKIEAAKAKNSAEQERQKAYKELAVTYTNRDFQFAVRLQEEGNKLYKNKAYSNAKEKFEQAKSQFETAARNGRAVAKAKQIDALLAEARSAQNASDWKNAYDKAEALLKIDENNKDALEIKRKSEAELASSKNVDQLVANIETSMRNKQFNQARQDLEKLQQLSTTKYVELKNKIDATEKRAQVETLLFDARVAQASTNWRLAYDKAEAALKLDKGNMEALSIKSRVENKLKPQMKIMARLQGAYVKASFDYNDKESITPSTIGPLKTGDVIKGTLSYRNGYDEYKGRVNEIVNWTGLKEITVDLEKVEANQSGKKSFDGTVVLPGGVELKMVKIEAGDTNMYYHVSLTKDYWIGQFEVTQAQYEAVMKTNPSYNKKGGNYPVERVSWDDALAFCKKLTEQEREAGRLPNGYEYSLPTEAQWECAASGGVKSKGYVYSGGNTLDAVGWYCENSGKERLDEKKVGWDSLKKNENSSHPVGQKTANELLLFDMSGNVREWCRDNSMVEMKNEKEHLCRGGSWEWQAIFCKTHNAPSTRRNGPYHYVGFRVALVPIDSTTASTVPKSETSMAMTATTGQDSTTSSSSFTGWDGKDRVLDLGNGVTMILKPIPKGSFMMGSPVGEPGRTITEAQHKVTLTRDFWLAQYEVTQGQWKAVMGTTLYDLAEKKYPGEGNKMVAIVADDYPIYYVRWDDASEFCNKLNNMKLKDIPAGYRFALPTEAQWEYACRAGTTTALYNGPIDILGENNAPALDEIAWYGGNSSVGYKGSGWKTDEWKEKQYVGGVAGPRKVGTKNANPWGLCDMIGNVWEWCSDWYGYYSDGDAKDSEGPSYGSYRVLRGGAWSNSARSCRSARRARSAPSDCGKIYGFRVALVPIDSTVSESSENTNNTPTGTKMADEKRETELSGRFKEDISINDTFDFDSEKEYKTVILAGVMFLRLVRIKPGSFMNTKINKKFTLTREYWLGETEVTQGQYAAIMDGVINALGESCNPRPSKFTGDDRLPVEEISWYDAKAFCEKLNSLFDGKLPKGYQFDLPTEAQWEFAARGGNISKEYEYSGGNDIEKVAWYWENAGRTTHPVGMKIANELGIYDMSGNVCEWCRDIYESDFAKDPEFLNGQLLEDNSWRMLRGGCWYSKDNGCYPYASRRRDRGKPTARGSEHGFRVALVPVQ